MCNSIKADLLTLLLLLQGKINSLHVVVAHFTSINQLPVDMCRHVNRKQIKLQFLSATFLTIKVNHRGISLLQSNSSPSMETAALPVNMFQLPLRFPCANGCVMCVRAARSDVPCPVRKSNQTMDLLLQAERMPSTQKAFISLLGLIHNPTRDGREANEYREGNVSLLHTEI